MVFSFDQSPIMAFISGIDISKDICNTVDIIKAKVSENMEILFEKEVSSLTYR